MGYLTPDSAPAATRGVVVFIPDHDAALYTLLGLLETLATPENWTQHGIATPEEIAEKWSECNADTATENLYS
jgi:hypothetical protein